MRRVGVEWDNEYVYRLGMRGWLGDSVRWFQLDMRDQLGDNLVQRGDMDQQQCGDMDQQQVVIYCYHHNARVYHCCYRHHGDQHPFYYHPHPFYYHHGVVCDRHHGVVCDHHGHGVGDGYYGHYYDHHRLINESYGDSPKMMLTYLL